MIAAAAPPKVSVKSRFFYAVLLALLLHVALIWNIKLTFSPPPLITSTALEIVLSQDTVNGFDDGDILTSVHQTGISEATERPELASLNTYHKYNVDPEAPLGEHPPTQTTPASTTATNNVGKFAPATKQATLMPVLGTTSPTNTPNPAASINTSDPAGDRKPIASAIKKKESTLRHSLNTSFTQETYENQSFGEKTPRKRQLMAGTKKTALESFYLDAWRRKVMAIGNLNHDQNLLGGLTLTVAIKTDGSIRDIRILESSGKPLLDDEAIRIVNMAAPFSSFPDEIKKDTDILEIVWTWKAKAK